MKYLATILTASLLLSSCEPVPNETKHVEKKNYYISNLEVSITEYVIDSCQYIGRIGGDSRSNYLTHKGNCTNPIHKK